MQKRILLTAALLWLPLMAACGTAPPQTDAEVEARIASQSTAEAQKRRILDGLLARSAEAMKKDDRLAALTFALAALEKEPTAAAALTQAGYVYLRMDNPERAQDAAMRGLQLLESGEAYEQTSGLFQQTFIDNMAGFLKDIFIAAKNLQGEQAL